MKKSLTALLAATTLVAGIAATPAEAHRGRGHGHAYGHDRYSQRYDDGRYYGRNYNDRYYNNGGYCRRENGTGGTIIGAIAGGLAGREIVGRRGDRTAGAIIGAGVGALAGRAIDRADSRCR